MSTSASPISYFTGISTYSQDLQNVISREVQIATLPITQMQNDLNQLTNESSGLQTLSGQFGSLQSAVSNLAAAATQTLSASSTNPGAIQATAGAGSQPGAYTVEVDNLGSYSDALSLATGLPKVTDPGSQNISSSTTYTLTVNNQQIQPPITLAANNLNALAQAINNANAGVQATVIDVGTSAAHDYRLSLQSAQYANVSMQLNDGNTNLLASSNTGQAVQYSVNGTPLTSGSRSVTLAQGVSLNLMATNVGTPATITVAENSYSIGNALQNFVTAYNSSVDAVNANRGQSGGALAGQSITYDLSNSLRNLAYYDSGAGGISSLNALGVTFADTSGHLSFDSPAFASATNGQASQVAQFLGSPTGGGFLQAATNALTGIVDPTSGSLAVSMNTTLAEISAQNQRISDKQDQVNQLQQNLTQQMAAADALIANMQQQATYFNNMWTAMQDAQAGRALG